MTPTPPTLPVEPARKTGIGVVSIIWIIPIFALIVALSVAWQSYNDRGSLIEISFADGAGISERETELRFRDVTVGMVEDVHFSESLDRVVASVRVDKNVASFIDVSASFWIVQPEISAAGITGLDTVLSGVYIEGSWDADIGAPATQFEGRDTVPLFRSGQSGLEIVLRTAPGGSMTDDAPITFRGIEVGRIGKASISELGDYAVAEAIIYDPHSRLISSATRFWDTTGFTFSVGPTGAELDFTSIATLLGGGVTFDTFVSGGTPANDGHIFDIYPGDTEARNSLFTEAEVETLQLQVVFNENISGLEVDSPVEINGLNIGRVQSVLGVIDESTYGDNRVRMNVILAIQPARLGMQREVTAEAALVFFADAVSTGLRAQLANDSLLTGGLKVDLVQTRDRNSGAMLYPGDAMIMDEDTLPQIPSIDSDLADATATVEGFITRVDNLPIEELLGAAIGFLESAEALVANEDLQQTPADLRALVGDISGIVGSDDAQLLLVNLNAGVTRFEALMADIQQAELMNSLNNALNNASAAADAVIVSVDGVPALLAQIQAVAAKAEAVPLDTLGEELTNLIAATSSILDQPAARELPQDLGDALAEINATLTELRNGGAVANFNATLGSARDAADAVAASTNELPALAARMRAVLDQAGQTIAGYNEGQTLTREAQSALRDISSAAEALESLARLLERNPDALIRGR